MAREHSGTGRRWALLGAALALSVGIWWWLGRTPEVAAPGAASVPTPGESSSDQDAAGGPGSSAVPEPGTARPVVNPTPGLPVTGQVLDLTGRAVDGAELLLERAGGAAATTADPEGRFLVRLGGAGPLAVTVVAAGYGETRFADLPAGPALELVLRSEVILAGVAVDADSEAAVPEFELTVRLVGVAGGEVGPDEPDWPARGERRVAPRPRVAREQRLEVADPEGRFQIGGLLPGTWELIARSPEGAAGKLRLELGPAGRQDVILELAHGGTVVGLVRDAETGEPVSGARAVLKARGRGPLARTDDEGRFVIAPAPPDTYWLHVRAAGYREHRLMDVTVAAGARVDLGDLELTPATAEEDDAPPRLIYGGIGASLGTRRGQVIVAQVHADGPAAREGLAEGDVVLSIDGDPVGDLDPRDVARKIRGGAGNVVELRVRRGSEELGFTLVRERIEMDAPNQRRRRR